MKITRRLFPLRIAAVVAVTALALAGCAPAAKTTSSKAESHIAVGVIYNPNSFDPYQSIWGGQWAAHMYAVYDTLIHREPDGSFTPGMATKWGYDSPTKFSFTIRKGMVFSDGKTPIDAAAVKANMDRIHTVVGQQTPKLAPMLEDVEVTGKYSVTLNLNAPNPSIPLLLAQPLGMLVNPTVLEKDPASLALTPAGSGPYVLDTAKTVVNSSYVYTRNKHFRDPGAFDFDVLEVKYFADQNAMLTALQSGVVQVGYGNPDVVSAGESAGLKVASMPVNIFGMILTDRDGKLSPPLGQEKVRQALNFAIDRAAILKTVYAGQGKVIQQPFPPGTDGFDKSLNDFYKYDVAKAKKLLTEAGYGSGFSFQVALTAPARDSNLAQAIASYFSEIGVKMDIVSLPAGANNNSELVKYPAFINGSSGQDTFGDARTSLMPGTPAANPHNSEDPELTALWQKAATAATPKERAAGFQKLSAAVVRKAWFVNVAQVNAIYFYDPKKVSNVVYTQGMSVPLIFGWKAVK
jgi:peptide/nickel transport system substrate-binding protein